MCYAVLNSDVPESIARNFIHDLRSPELVCIALSGCRVTGSTPHVERDAEAAPRQRRFNIAEDRPLVAS